ncbi:MAG: hypothetical protein ACOVT5_12125 [Armatimonadaceae bacterium]
MSPAVMPEPPTDMTEPVDPPEVVRETAGVDRVVRLQIEYRKKLRGLVKRHTEQNPPESSGATQPSRAAQVMISWLPKVPRPRLVKKVRPLLSAAERLARYASGLIESARIPQLDKIELQLRNAELEAELIEARHLIG